MPFFYDIAKDTAEGKRRAERLLALRALLEQGAGTPGAPGYSAPVPERTVSRTLLLASWNLREFDATSYGKRLDEAMYYIAEVCSRFDLVAIQEVRTDLRPLDTLRDLLGDTWRYIVTDVTKGDLGNRERLAFLYDTRTVRFSGLAAEVVLPPNDDGTPAKQPARTPFLVGFEAGWFKFSLCTVHILYGDKTPDPADRVAEIGAVATHLADQVKKARERSDEDPGFRSEYENVFLLGDFNIFDVTDATFQALTAPGFKVLDALLGARTNVGQDKRSFDQIAFVEDARNLAPTGQAGVVDYYREVFRDTTEDRDLYADAMRTTIEESNANKPPSKKSKLYDDRDEGGKTLYYRTYWRTYQMSDHLPLWIELRIDFSQEYLERRANP